MYQVYDLNIVLPLLKAALLEDMKCFKVNFVHEREGRNVMSKYDSNILPAILSNT